MNSYYREATVGLLVVLATAIFLGGALWLRGRSITGGHDARVHFVDIGALKEGSPVRTSGAQIGRVERITFNGVGDIDVDLTFDVPNLRPTTTATATIRSVGMLGDQELVWDPGTGEPLPAGATIQGTIAGGLFDKGAELADQASATMTALNRMLDTSLVIDLRQTLRASERLMTYLGDRREGPAAEVNATLRQLQSVTARLDTAIVALDAPRLSARLDTTLVTADRMAGRLSSMSARLDTLLLRIQRGEGTLGKLMSDTLLYTDLQGTLHSTRAMLDSLAKHPERLGITVRVF